MGTPVCVCGHSHGSFESICPIVGCSCNTFTDQRDADIRNLKEQKGAAETMAKALEDRAKAAEVQVVELRETVTRLNRRCQEAERAANVKVEDIRKQGGSFGRALAAWSAGDQRRRADGAESQVKEFAEANDLLKQQVSQLLENMKNQIGSMIKDWGEAFAKHGFTLNPDLTAEQNAAEWRKAIDQKNCTECGSADHVRPYCHDCFMT